MDNLNILNDLLESLKTGSLDKLTEDKCSLINDTATQILLSSKANPDILSLYPDTAELIKVILRISDILYNNTDLVKLPLDHGVYDLLLVLYRKYDPSYIVGAEPIQFESTISNIEEDNQPIKMIKYIDIDKVENDFLFYDQISKITDLNTLDCMKRPFSYIPDDTSKRLVNVAHSYPELVGTLDKCKFVLNSQAIERGVFNDSNVTILERDFFQKHIEAGILDPNQEFTIVFELKYDGVSVEADVTDRIHAARSRGDAVNDIGADITPILYDYRFKHAPLIIDKPFGMKFEAIMTYDNLIRYNKLRGKEYKNCRTAISGLFGSSDAYLYKDLITLVPLATSLHNIDRITEIEFMNKYYHSGEQLRYAVVTGDFTYVMFMAKRFAEEAEYMREYLPFMYDGIVVSYLDKDIREKLGRVNAINKYSIAVKFNPIKKQTIFRGYAYTVGQDGIITPMIYYDPVEFYGTIHPKSSGHSYERFKKLGLRIGDIIDVEYVNDVMPYVTKPDNSHNANNTNPVVEFITECPFCGTSIEISKSGKSALCPNIKCPERNLKRMVGMMKKMNLKDFAEESLNDIGKYTLVDLFNLTKEDIIFLGDVNSQKFINMMNDLKTKPIYDYNIIGSMGFTGIAIEKWRLILNKYSLSDILSMDHEQLKHSLLNIKGIGPSTADTIIAEMEFHYQDLIYINDMSNIIVTKGNKFGKKIRFTGVRDSAMVQQLVSLGHNAGEGAITKDTDILIIPFDGYTSSKTQDAINNGNTIIVPIQEFKANTDKYL